MSDASILSTIKNNEKVR